MLLTYAAYLAVRNAVPASFDESARARHAAERGVPTRSRSHTPAGLPKSVATFLSGGVSTRCLPHFDVGPDRVPSGRIFRNLSLSSSLYAPAVPSAGLLVQIRALGDRGWDGFSRTTPAPPDFRAASARKAPHGARHARSASETACRAGGGGASHLVGVADDSVSRLHLRPSHAGETLGAALHSELTTTTVRNHPLRQALRRPQQAPRNG